eukprot:scaffold121996_cov94-Cyclotella_meneghiniana.AAC.1
MMCINSSVDIIKNFAVAKMKHRLDFFNMFGQFVKSCGRGDSFNFDGMISKNLRYAVTNKGENIN